MTNTVGVVMPGTISASYAYREEIETPRRFLCLLLLTAATGGLAGGLLLKSLGAKVFEEAVPVLLILGAVLIILQPLIFKYLAPVYNSRRHTPVVMLGTFIACVYAGYFGAAAGVILVALFVTLLPAGIQRANALKSVAGLAANAAAAVYFAIALPVDWSAAVLLAIGSFVGGQIGVHVAKRLPDGILRVTFAVGGTAAALVALH